MSSITDFTLDDVSKLAPPSASEGGGYASADQFVNVVGSALERQESGGKQLRPDGTPVTSKAGAIGIWQVMPKTAPEAAKLAGVEFDDVKYRNDANYNRTIGQAYLRKQFEDFQDPAKALAAYNAGPTAVNNALLTAEKQGNPNAWMQYLPRETQNYVPAILGRVNGLTSTGEAKAAGTYYTPNQTNYASYKEPGPGATFGDYIKEIGAAAVESVGSMGQAVGEVGAAVANKATGTEQFEGKNLLKPASEAIRGTMTEGGKQARQETNIEGSVLDLLSGDAQLPSTGQGWAMIAANGFGSLVTSFLPVVGQAGKVATLTKELKAAEAAGDAIKAAQLAKQVNAAGTTARVSGAALAGTMTGGAAADEVRQTASKQVSGMSHEELMLNVPVYAEAFKRSGDEQQSRDAVVNSAAQWAGGLSAIAGAAGGAFNAKVVEDFLVGKGVANIAGNSFGSKTARAAGTGAVTSFGEGAQETSEKFGQNVGENIGLGRAPTDNAMRNTAGDFIGGAVVGGPLGAGGGYMAKPGQPAPIIHPTLQPVADKAAQGGILSKAAMAGNAGNLATGAMPVGAANVVPGAEAPGAPVEQPASAAVNPSAKPTDAMGEQVRAIEAELRGSGLLDTLREDGVNVPRIFDDLNTARNVNAPAEQRQESLAAVTELLQWAKENKRPAAPMDTIETPQSPQSVPPEEQQQAPVMDAAIAALRDDQFSRLLSDQDRSNLVHAIQLAQTPDLPVQTRANAAQVANEIVGRYQAPQGQGSGQTTPALATPAASLTQTPENKATPVGQQFVNPATGAIQESDFLTDASAPSVKIAEGKTPAFIRKRAEEIKQLVAMGFESVERNGSEFFLINSKTGQRFKLTGMADSQLARKAIKDYVDAKAHTAATSPKNDLKIPGPRATAADRYKKGEIIDLNGVKVKVENPEGSIRTGTSPEGEIWETTMVHHYGDIERTSGADGDKVDVFIGPRPDSTKIFVIDQLKQDGSFDEHKVMMGFTSEEAARAGYLANYEKGWTGLGAITEMGVDEFKSWVKSPDAKKPVAKVAQKAAATSEKAVDLEKKPEAANDATPTTFATYAEAKAFIMNQRRNGSDLTALPYPNEDGTFGVAVKGTPGFAKAEKYAADQQKKTKKAKKPSAKKGEVLIIKDEGEDVELERVNREDLPLSSKPTPGRRRQPTQGDVTLLQFMAGALGKELIIYSDPEGKRADGFTIPGQPNTIYLADSTTVHPVALFGHELFHTIAETNPKAWASISKVVSKNTGKDAQERMTTRGYDKDQAQIELISDIGGDLLSDPKFWTEVFADIEAANGKQAKGIIAQLVAYLNGVIDRLISNIKQPGYNTSGLIKDVRAVRAAYKEAITQHLKTSGITRPALQAQILRDEQSIKKSKPVEAPTTGIHFSQQPRTVLTGSMYGTGLRGAEAERLERATDSRIKNRISFYVDEGNGVSREAGTGGYAHEIQLPKLYNAGENKENLFRGGTLEQLNDSESRILDAGYGGYWVPSFANGQGVGVILGEAADSVEATPTMAPQGGEPSLKKGLLSREVQAIDVHNIPGAFMRAGTLTVPKSSVEAANDEFTRIGSAVRFSKAIIETPEQTAKREYAEVEAEHKGKDSWMKAPNGEPTKLSERQWVQVRTSSFKAWFGDWEAAAKAPGGVFSIEHGGNVSVAVDENGEPLVVYHGTNKGGFTEFNTPGGEKRGDLGIFTTPNLAMAQTYYSRRGGEIDLSDLTQSQLEDLGYGFDLDSDGNVEVTDPNAYAVDGPSSNDFKFASISDAVKKINEDGESGGERKESGYYAMFINIRNPEESDFEGAHWNGERPGQYQVMNQDGELQSDASGNSYFDMFDDANELAKTVEGGEVQPADDHYETTDGVVRSAISLGFDGAYIRNVVDSGPGYSAYIDEPSSIFVALEPGQLKSANFNNGAYSATTADIRKSLRIPDFVNPEDRVEVSTTRPKQKARLGASYDEKWVIDGADVKASQKHIDAINGALKKYNTLSGKGNASKLMKELHDVVVENLLWLHDKVPEAVRARAKLWYDGANRIASDWTAPYGISLRQAAGVLAVLSPQMDWFKNVSLGERVISIWKGCQNEPWSPAMTNWVRSWVNASTDVDTKEARMKILREVLPLEGLTLSEMNHRQAALYVRAFDEAYNERQYRLVTPEGGFGDYVTNSDDGDASVTWGGFGTIEKAIAILDNPSFKTVDEELGDEHKVRNFFNNIISPNSADGHVTIDTHAVAAALFKALSGSADEVKQNFGAAGQNAETGASGTYALFADAYRDAAAQRDLLPREMQSITWEAVRALFPAAIKDKLAPLIEAVWNRFKGGKISREEARNEVHELSGGIRPMAWEGSTAGQFASDGGASFKSAVGTEPSKRAVRTLEPAVAKDKLVISMSANTSTIPGVAALQEAANNGDEFARSLLQNVALDNLRHLLAGTSAKVKAERMTGLYDGSVESSVSASITFADEDREKILAGLAKFADNFNQEQIHVRRNSKEKVGREYEDGSYVTPVFRWTLAKAMSQKQIQKVIDESGLTGLNFGDDFVEAYYVGDTKNEEAFKKFEQGAGLITKSLGKNATKSDSTNARLWAYGHGERTIGFDAIRGDVSPGDGVKSDTAKRVAEYLNNGARVKTFDQASEITAKQDELQSEIAKVYESLPDNDLKNPNVRRAYNELAKEVIRQFRALPVKVEVLSGQGEPYANSAAMRRDILDNNHLSIFGTTPETFGPAGADFTGHPLLEPTGIKDQNGVELLYNDLLRAVHDYYAHAMSETQFGPKGEEAAWKNHMAMTSNMWARWALTAETRGQNSWVNFHEGLDRSTKISEREFARQKAVLLPAKYALTGDRAVDKPMKEFISKLSERAAQGSKPENDGGPGGGGKINKSLPISERFPNTPEFKKWFKDSAVVNADGTPRVMYHGTTEDFDTFSSKRGSLLYFTQDPEVAGDFADGTASDNDTDGGENILPVYLSAQNVFDPDNADHVAKISRPSARQELADGGMWDAVERHQREIKAAGFDGIYVRETPATDADARDVAVFGSSQVKSAIGNNGDFSDSPNITKSLPVPEFYSQLQRAIEGVPERLATMSAPAWKQWIEANAAKLGVKKDEVEWSGIKDFLDLQGKAKITKADISAYLADSGVKVSEATLGNTGLDGVGDMYVDVTDYDSESPEYAVFSEDGEIIGGTYATENDANNAMDAMKGDKPSKYSQYTLPGGENYREVLITLPAKSLSVEEAREVLGAKPDAKLSDADVSYASRKAASEYRSSHWDDANVLAHIRVNDRTDADGNRVLFVEEVQSDWGQEGLKKGFRGSKKFTVRQDSSGAEALAGRWEVIDQDGNIEEGFKTEAEARKWADIEQRGQGVPSGPFITKTEGWLNLALKRIAMMAVEGGYDKVAFVNGEQSADRYDLSKRIDRITARKSPVSERGIYLKAIGKDGGKGFEQKDVKPEELEGLVGKEIAEKIKRQMDDKGSASLADLDLKVGGEGMIKFYDQIVPQNLSKLLPKLGGEKLDGVLLKKQAVYDSATGEVSGVVDYGVWPVNGKFELRGRAGQGVISTFATGDEAFAEAVRLQNAGALKQPGFDVTDKMRKTVSLGVPLFSRPIEDGPRKPWFEDINSIKLASGYQVGDFITSSKKVTWWDKSVGTMYNLAEKHPEFKRVFDAVQRFIDDVSVYANKAADLAPNILPKLETWKDIAKSPMSAADVAALRDPIFQGTLSFSRDENGDLQPEDDVEKAGVVFSNQELRDYFQLNDRQIALYREFRAAVNQSITTLNASDMLRYLGEDGDAIREQVMAAKTVKQSERVIAAHLDLLIEQQPKRAEVLTNTKEVISEKVGQAIGLMARGYAPLSRYGEFTVYVVGKDGEQQYFSMFESQAEANKMAREMREQYPDSEVTTGTMSKESYKLFSGVTPESLALFGEALGLEENGVDEKSQAYQQYLKLAKSNRSAMKRLIQRKGIDGFSEDAGRVLAGFVYSNARQVSTNLHAGEIGKSAAAVKSGDLKDMAIKLMNYIQNPQEEAQAVRGLMFAQYIGGSIASALVNMTQPFTMTMPYLSQFAGVTGAAARMADAVKLVSKGITDDDELAKALKRAEADGVVSPQEVHQLMAQSQGKGALQSGDGTKSGDALAKANNTLAKISLGWGKLFGSAEQFNRRVTFIAAYKVAREQKMADPFAFAENAIRETQGVYNKGNKPAWARGAVGATLFTFKQYSIAYVEFLQRMWGNGPEGKKAVGMALLVLFAVSGLGGMPGADDLDDVIDGIAQRVFNKSFDSKQAKKEFLAGFVGDGFADFLMGGITSIPGSPIDLSGRMGLGNLIPGTGFFTKKSSYTRDLAEIGGPAFSMASNWLVAAGQVAQGDVGKAAKTMSPQAIQNLVKASDMWTMGMYRDEKGRKVVDVDAWEGLVKAIGFQPASVKKVQEATSTQQNLIGQNKLRETEIADLWTAGRVERDQDKIARAKEQLADWNRDNPSSPIKIDPTQINKRVQQANQSKAQRIAATAPKEIRSNVAKELDYLNR